MLINIFKDKYILRDEKYILFILKMWYISFFKIFY